MNMNEIVIWIIFILMMLVIPIFIMWIMWRTKTYNSRLNKLMEDRKIKKREDVNYGRTI